MYPRMLSKMTWIFFFFQSYSTYGHEKHPFLTAIITEDAIYATKPIYAETCRVIDLASRTLDKGGRFIDNQYRIAGLSDKELMRCKIRYDAVWCTGAQVNRLPNIIRLPMDDLAFYQLDGLENRFEKLRKKYAVPDNTESRFLFCPWPIEDYINASYLDAIQKMKEATPTPTSHYFDFHPLKANNVRLFFLKVNKMEVWETHGPKFSEKFGSWDENWAKQPLRVHQAPFSEPFLVYASGDLHYFVTKSGHIYTDKMPDSGKLKLTSFKTEEGRTIQAIVTDATSDRTFVFGYEDKVKRNYLLELKDKPAYHYFDLKDIKPFKAVAPLDEALRYVQHLKETNRLKSK